MNRRIFLKRRPSAKPCPCPCPCPNCGELIAPGHASSIAFIAAMHGTNAACCLRCTLDEVELIDHALYLDLPLLCSVVPAPEPVAGKPGSQRRTRRCIRGDERPVRWL